MEIDLVQTQLDQARIDLEMKKIQLARLKSQSCQSDQSSIIVQMAKENTSDTLTLVSAPDNPSDTTVTLVTAPENTSDAVTLVSTQQNTSDAVTLVSSEGLQRCIQSSTPLFKINTMIP